MYLREGDLLAFIYVGIGGFLGSCLRYLFNIICKDFAAVFPFGTLLSNVVAGLLIGFIIGLDRQTDFISPQMKLFLTTGLLGGLSTFSTFSMETVDLFSDGQYFICSLNILLNLALSLLGVVIGIWAAKTAFNKV